MNVYLAVTFLRAGKIDNQKAGKSKKKYRDVPDFSRQKKMRDLKATCIKIFNLKLRKIQRKPIGSRGNP